MCTLWQRYGRAGRGPGTVAIAILLVEKANFDTARDKKEQRKRLRKAKKAPPSKRRALADTTNSTPVSSSSARIDESDGDSSTDEESSATLPFQSPPSPPAPPAPATDAERRHQYHAPATLSSEVQVKKRGVIVHIGGAMDDFINAKTRGIKCRRQVATLYFGNDNIRRSCNIMFYALRSPSNHSRQ